MNNTTAHIFLTILIWIICPAPSAFAADDTLKTELTALSSRLKYQQGRIDLKSDLAAVNLTESFRYVDPAGAETLLTGIWGNPSMERKPLGMIVPRDFDPFSQGAWCVIIQFEEDGYVKDDDAGRIDYTKMLKEMKEATKAECGTGQEWLFPHRTGRLGQTAPL